MFDWTIKFGDILTIMVLAGGALLTIYIVRDRVNALSVRMASLETKMESLVALLVAQGRHEERLDGVDARLTLYVQAQEALRNQVDRLFEPAQFHRKP